MGALGRSHTFCLVCFASVICWSELCTVTSDVLLHATISLGNRRAPRASVDVDSLLDYRLSVRAVSDGC